MSYKLELFYFDECPYCQRVLGAIKDYSIKNIIFSNTRKEPSKKNQLLADTGRQTVPCLYINGRPMHESSDIIQWLKAHQNELN